MAEERVNTPLRMRLSMRRRLDEVAELQGGLSREAIVHVLLMDGLTAAYARLGFERDPAAVAVELLDVLSAIWESELSDEEIKSIAVTRTAIERIAQVRARDEKTGG
jgi:hypothetical protein